MKTLISILLLALASSAMAAETDSNAGAERHVADDLLHVTLPTGEVVMRLVSRSGISVRQYWIGSVYGNQQSIVVFQGGSAITPGYADARFAPKGERQIARIE